MKKVLIGSTAIKHHFPDFNREPKDLDYALSEGEKREGDEDSMVIPLVTNNSDTDIATPEMLLTLKISHIFFNEKGEMNWQKHMWDIQFLLSKGVEYDWELMLELKEFWTKHYGGLRRSNLKQSAEDFFDNAINNDIDHDAIHLIINPVPMYTKILKDGMEVETCPIKFNSLSERDKLEVFREEVMVMGWERYRRYHHRKAYYTMAKKFIREHVPMFSFDHAIRNWIQLSKSPYNFIELINSKYQPNELSNRTKAEAI